MKNLSHEITRLTKQNDALRRIARKALDALHEAANYQANAHEYDEHIGVERREFDQEDWGLMRSNAMERHATICDELEKVFDNA